MATVRYTNIINDTQLMITTQRIATRRLRQVAQFTEIAAKQGTHGPYSKGQLRRAITTLGPYPRGWSTHATVLADPIMAPHAVVVERGAEVHSIFPKSAPFVWRFYSHKRPQLRFVWHGRVVFAPHIPMSPHTIGRSHPGMQGKRYMRKAAVLAGARFRMQVIIYPT